MTFLKAGVSGGTHGIRGLFGVPSTVSGGIRLCINFNGLLPTKTFGDSYGAVTGFAGNKQGPLIDGLSGVDGPISKGILDVAANTAVFDLF